MLLQELSSGEESLVWKHPIGRLCSTSAEHLEILRPSCTIFKLHVEGIGWLNPPSHKAHPRFTFYCRDFYTALQLYSVGCLQENNKKMNSKQNSSPIINTALEKQQGTDNKIKVTSEKLGEILKKQEGGCPCELLWGKVSTTGVPSQVRCCKNSWWLS